jgi:hypothetical protein
VARDALGFVISVSDGPNRLRLQKALATITRDYAKFREDCPAQPRGALAKIFFLYSVLHSQSVSHAAVCVGAQGASQPWSAVSLLARAVVVDVSTVLDAMRSDQSRANRQLMAEARPRGGRAAITPRAVPVYSYGAPM